MPSFYEELNGLKIHYEKFGTGPKVLLLIHGVVSSSRAAFFKQLDGGLDRDLFTLIAIDIPGWGKSRPPERIYTLDVYKRDAVTVADFMIKLGYKIYSIIGWSYGSIVATTVAANNQARIEKLVLVGGPAHVSEGIIQALTSVRDIDKFELGARNILIETYGKEIAQQLWDNEMAFWDRNPPRNGVPIWDLHKEMRSLRCPTLIVHGARDKLIDKTQAYVSEKLIPDSRVVLYPEASHDPHITCANEFNKVVTDFLFD